MGFQRGRDSLPLRFPTLFHECWHCHTIGLRPGILSTGHGEYGTRQRFEGEQELSFNTDGLCESCVKHFDKGHL